MFDNHAPSLAADGIVFCYRPISAELAKRLAAIEFEEEGVRLIERIMSKDESVIYEVERIDWRPRLTGLVEEIRTSIEGVDPNILLSALEEEAKRRGVKF